MFIYIYMDAFERKNEDQQGSIWVSVVPCPWYPPHGNTNKSFSFVASGQMVTKGLSKSSRVAGTPFPATWHHVGNTMLAMCSCSNLHPTPAGKPGPGGTGAVHSTLNKTLPVNSSLPLIGGRDALLAPVSVAAPLPRFHEELKAQCRARDWFLSHKLSHPDEKSSLQRPWLWAPRGVKGQRINLWEYILSFHHVGPGTWAQLLNPGGRCSCLLSRLISFFWVRIARFFS